MKRKEPEFFNAHLNPAYDYIEINQEKVLVSISRSEENRYTISFYYKGQHHDLVLPALTSNGHIFGSGDILFGDVNLEIFEKEKLAKRLNQMLDSYFG